MKKVLIVEFGSPDFLSNNYSGTSKNGYMIFNYLNNSEDYECWYASYFDNDIPNMMLIQNIDFNIKYDCIIINALQMDEPFKELYDKVKYEDTKWVCICQGLYYNEEYLAKYFDKVVFASEYIHKLYHVNNGISIYNPIDISLFKDLNINHKRLENAIVISYNSSKGNVREFLDNIYPLVKKQIPDFKCYICEPKYLYDNNVKSEEYANDKDIVFLGNLTIEDLIKLYNRIPVSWDQPDMEEVCPYNVYEHLLCYVNVLSYMECGSGDVVTKEYKDKYALKYKLGVDDHNIANLIIDRINNYWKYKDDLIREHNYMIERYDSNIILEQYKNLIDKLVSHKTIDMFDKIYILHLASEYDRYDHCLTEFNRIGLGNKVEFFNCVTHAIDEKIGNYLDSLHTEYYKYVYENHNKMVYKALYNVVTNHYNLIKMSYELGYNYIMIFEDDVQFYGDAEYFNNIINKIPEDFDILKLKSGHGDDPENQARLRYDNNFEDVFTITHNPDMGCSAEGYCLSRKGMKAIIDELDNELIPYDLVLERIIERHSHELNIYQNNYEIIVQNNKIPSLTV